MLPDLIAPWMLWGAAAVSIPVLIHIMNRRRFKVVQWAAMDFLRDVTKKSTRVIKLKDLILLLMRTAALLFLVLAMTRMGCRHSGSWGGKAADGDALLVFDTSYSMSYVIGNESRLDRAKKAALKILNSYGTRSRIHVLTVNDVATPLFEHPTDNLQLAEKAIKAVSGSERSGRITHILQAAADELDALHGRPRHIFVFTDLQARAWDVEVADPDYQDAQRRLARADGVYVIDCSQGSIQNVAVTELVLPDRIAVAGVPAELTARLTNTGQDPRDDVRLALRVYGLGEGGERGDSGVPFARQAQLVGAPTTAPRIPVGGPGVSLKLEPFTFEKPGSYLVEAFIDGGDSLQPDNRRFLAVDVRPAVKVLCIEGSRVARETAERYGETLFLRQLIAPFLGDEPDRKFPYEPVRMTLEEAHRYEWESAEDATEDRPDNVRRYALVVLANVREPRRNLVEALERFVGRGGGLMVFFGEKTRSEDLRFADFLYRDGLGLAPARPTDAVGVPFAKRRPGDPLFVIDTSPGQLQDRVFQTGNAESDRRATFSKPMFSKIWKLALPQNDEKLKEKLKQQARDRQRSAATTEPARAAKPPAPPRTKLASGRIKTLDGSMNFEVGEPRVIARFTGAGNEPFAIRREFGKGRVLMFNTTANSEWTNLPGCNAVVMYLYAVRDLVGAEGGVSSTTVGSSLVYAVPRRHTNADFAVIGPSGPVEPRTAAPAGKDALGQQRWVIEYDGEMIREAGPYCFDVAGSSPDSSARRYFGVNVDPGEAQLAPLPPTTVPTRMPILGEDHVTVAKYPSDIAVVVEDKQPVTELSLPLLLLALLLFAAEPLFAAWFSPKPVVQPKAGYVGRVPSTAA
jgi:hypothetical protein